MHAYRKIEDEKEIEKIYNECVAAGRRDFQILNTLRKLAMLLATLAVCFGMRFMYNYSETASIYTVVILFTPLLLILGREFTAWGNRLYDNLDFFNDLTKGEFYCREETISSASASTRVVRLYVKSKDGVMIPIAHQKLRGKDEAL